MLGSAQWKILEDVAMGQTGTGFINQSASAPKGKRLTKKSVVFALAIFALNTNSLPCQAKGLFARAVLENHVSATQLSQSLVHESLVHKINGACLQSTALKTAQIASLAGPVVGPVLGPVVGPVECSRISNFDIVSEGLWRGAAPSQQAMTSLAQSGVKTIVDLRMDGQGAQAESQRAQQLGIKYFHIPLGFKGASLPKVAQFMNIVDNPVNQPVFVHCRYGADRTGALVAIFRVLHDHWTFKQAYTEMKSHHFKPWLAGLRRLVARVEDSPKVQSELKMLTDKPQSNSSDQKQVASKSSNRS